MRIAFLATAFPTLSDTFVLDKATGLLARGHDVQIYTDRPGELARLHPDVERYGLLARTHAAPMPSGMARRFLKGAGLLTRHVWREPRLVARALDVRRHGELAGYLVLLYGALPLLGRERFDVVHAHFGPNGVKGAFFRENGLVEGRLVTSFHGYDVTVYPRRRGADVYRYLFAHGDRYFANSGFLVRRAIALGCPAERIETLATGVDLQRFRPPAERPPADRELTVLTVARLVEVKGVEFALRGFARAAARDPRLRYSIVGEGPLRGSLERLARELGVAERVVFHGGEPQNRVLARLGNAHVFVLSSVVGSDGAEEGQGGVLTEAQATGLPVVATDVGGIPDTIVPGESGLLVPERDPEALAEALLELAADPARRAAMGRVGRAHAEASFDLEALNDRLVELYRRALVG